MLFATKQFSSELSYFLATGSFVVMIAVGGLLVWWLKSWIKKIDNKFVETIELLPKYEYLEKSVNLREELHKIEIDGAILQGRVDELSKFVKVIPELILSQNKENSEGFYRLIQLQLQEEIENKIKEEISSTEDK